MSFRVPRVLFGLILVLGLGANMTFVRDMGICGLLLMYIIEAVRERRFFFVRTPLGVPLLLFFLTAVLSLFTAMDVPYSLVEIRSELLRNALMYYLLIMSFRHEKDVALLVSFLLLTSVLTLGYGLYDFQRNHGSLTSVMPYRAKSFFRDFQYYGTFLIQVGPLFLLLPKWLKGRRPMVFAGISLIILCFSVYITHARWVWIVFFIELVLCVLLVMKKKYALIVAVLALALFAVAIPKQVWKHELPPNPGQVKSSTHARLILLDFSVGQILKSPFLGIGYGRLSFKKAFPDFVAGHVHTMWHAHSLYLNVALQMGLQGLAALLFLLIRALWTWRPKKPSESETSFQSYLGIAVFIMIIGFLLRNIADDLFVDVPANLFWFLLGISCPLITGCCRPYRNRISETCDGSPVPVLYVFAALPVGGAEMLLYNQIEALDRSRFRPMVCSLRDKGPMGKKIEELGVPVFALQGLKSNRFEFQVILRLKQLLIREKVSIVHTHLLDGGRYGRIAALWAGSPCIVSTFHNVYTRRRMRIHLINRFLGKFTHRIIAVSEAVKRDLLRYDGLEPDKVLVIPNMIDLDAFGRGDRERVRRELGFTPRELVLGCVARLEEQKGHVYLLEAANLLRRQRAGIRLLLVGDGRLRSSIEHKAKELGLLDVVVFTGTSNRVAELMSAMDVFVLPSLWEGLGLVLGEAMASGVPVVSTEVGGTSEIVLDGETGLLIPPGDPEAIRKAVIRILDDREATRTMTEQARHRVVRLMSKQRHMALLEAVYEELLRPLRGVESTEGKASPVKQ